MRNNAALRRRRLSKTFQNTDKLLNPDHSSNDEIYKTYNTSKRVRFNSK